jgi:hypothetical protein
MLRAIRGYGGRPPFLPVPKQVDDDMGSIPIARSNSRSVEVQQRSGA